MHKLILVILLIAAGRAMSAQETRTIVRMPIHGVVPDDLDQRIQRVVLDAQSRSANAIVLDIDVWQGSLPVVMTAIDWIATSEVPVHTLVTGVAHEIGALLALATNNIYMTAEASIGGRVNGYVAIDAELENDIDAMRREFGTLAERRGLDITLAHAMADPTAVISGIVDSTEALALTAQGAVQLGVATGMVSDIDDLADSLHLSNATVVSANARGFTGATIEIENNSWRDTRVFLVRGGSRRRLGMVTSMGKREYTIEPGALGSGTDIRLVADPVGGAADHVTQMIRMMPGIVIQWQLQNNPAQSTVFVFRP